MTDMHTRVSGTWKTVARLHTRVSGVWKEVFRGYVRVSGVWKEFFGGFVTVTNITESHTDSNVTICSIRFNRDGSIDVGKGSGSASYSQIHAGEWWSNEPNQFDIGDFYEIRCQSVTTGSPDLVWNFAEAAAVGTYIGMTASREWGVNAQGGKIGPNTKSITVSSFQIRVNGGAVQDTFNISVTAIRV